MIHSIETFGTVDGPGVRYVVFFQGCPLRCKYCHNPDTWAFEGGTPLSVEEIMAGYEKKRVFYKNGGITATGGEPLGQIDFLIALFREAKQRGIHTCLDTSGIFFREDKKDKFLELTKVCDYVMLDIKHVRNEDHKVLCGMENHAVFKFLHFLEEEKVPVRIRHVLVPGITMEESALRELGAKLSEFKNIREVEVLPYHTLGVEKYQNLNIPYPLEGTIEPTKEETAEARKFIIEGINHKPLS